MKRTFVLLIGLVALAAIAAVVGLVVRARSKPAAVATHAAPKPEPAIQRGLPRDFERRRAAWLKQHPGGGVPGAPAMSVERLRRMQLSRFELASLAQEMAMSAMALGEGERGELRRALAAQHAAVLLRIEQTAAPGGARAPSSPADFEKLIAGPSDTYRKRGQGVLGETRFAELERLERQERDKLAMERRIYRKTLEKAGGSPAPKR